MRVRKKAKVDPLPEEFASIEEAAEFWDTHDATDYLQFTRPVKNVKVNITRRHFLVALEPSIFKGLLEVARSRGISSQALLNLWLQEKLQAAKRHDGKG